MEQLSGYLVQNTVKEVVEQIKKILFVEIEASGRHAHLSRKDVDQLFGVNYQLTRAKDLSQPGQYACKERISVTGPKGTIHNVVILGPERKETQIEVSVTDCLSLGIKAPVRQSGDLQGTVGALLQNGEKTVIIERGIMVAKRHLHLSVEDAKRLKIKDGEIIKLKVFGERPLILEDLVARVSEKFATYVHIDYDEANASGCKTGTMGMILK